MAIFSVPSQYPDVFQALDAVRGAGAGPHTVQVDASALPTGPAACDGVSPPTLDLQAGSAAATNNAWAGDFEGLDSVTLEGINGKPRIRNNGQWVLLLGDASNITIRNLYLRSDRQGPSNGLIFAVPQGFTAFGVTHNPNGQAVDVEIDNVTFEVSPWHEGGIQSNSSNRWNVHDNRFCAIPGQDPGGAYSTVGPSHISFFDPQNQGGASWFVIERNEFYDMEQWSNSSGIGQNFATDGNAIIFDHNDNQWTGDIKVCANYAENIGSEFLNLFKFGFDANNNPGGVAAGDIHVCRNTAKHYGYLGGVSSTDQFTRPPENTLRGFSSGLWASGTNVSYCKNVADRDGVGQNTFLGSFLDINETGTGNYLVDGFAGFGSSAVTGTLNGGNPSGGLASPDGTDGFCEDNVVVCPDCADCTVDVNGQPYTCANPGAFRANAVVVDCTMNTNVPDQCLNESWSIDLNALGGTAPYAYVSGDGEIDTVTPNHWTGTSADGPTKTVTFTTGNGSTCTLSFNATTAACDTTTDCSVSMSPINLAGATCGQQMVVQLANYTTGAVAGTTWTMQVTGGGTLDDFDSTTGVALVTPTSSPMTFAVEACCP